MKELSIEEKAKAYDEAMNKLRTMRDAWNNLETDYSPKDVVHDIEYYFPELKESGDEKIRKRIIERLKSMEVGSPTEIGEEVAWLEKQGEQKPNVVVRRFLIGDTFIDKYYPTNVFTVTEYIENGIAYVDQSGERFTKYYDDSWDDYQLIEQKPAEWNEKYIADIFEKVGLAKIVREQENDALTEALQSAMIELAKYSVVPQPKPAWSEEDENIKKNISHIIRQYDKISKKENQPCWYVGDCLLWMQNIKDRVQPQSKQEWSEEDKKALEVVTDVFEQYGVRLLGYPAFVHWLKILPERITFNPYWKPSDEQMGALYTYIYNPQYFNSQDPRMKLVESVYHDLKKLK